MTIGHILCWLRRGHDFAVWPDDNHDQCLRCHRCRCEIERWDEQVWDE